MSAQDDDRGARALWPALVNLASLAVILAIGLAIGQAPRQGGAQPQPVQRAAVVLASVASHASHASQGGNGGAGEQASVKEENGIVQFTFASASAALAPQAREALGIVVKGVAAGQKAVISGFGQAEDAPELTARRMQAVRETLTELGIGDDKIELAPPQPPASSAGAAGRVEVRLE